MMMVAAAKEAQVAAGHPGHQEGALPGSSGALAWCHRQMCLPQTMPPTSCQRSATHAAAAGTLTEDGEADAWRLEGVGHHAQLDGAHDGNDLGGGVPAPSGSGRRSGRHQHTVLWLLLVRARTCSSTVPAVCCFSVTGLAVLGASAVGVLDAPSAADSAGNMQHH